MDNIFIKRHNDIQFFSANGLNTCNFKSLNKKSENLIGFREILQKSKIDKYKCETEDLLVDKKDITSATLIVDRLTYDQIVNFTTNNPKHMWDELGMDDEKRWVVINGQRFESPLTEEEKERIRRAKKGFLAMFLDYEKKKEKIIQVKNNERYIQKTLFGINSLKSNGL